LTHLHEEVFLPKQVLLVESHAPTQALIETTLSGKCKVSCAPTLAAAEAVLRSHIPSLLILAADLPDGSGFDFCQRLRQQEAFNPLSIVFLTDRADLHSRVQGLTLGADDYLTHPMESSELSARIEAHLRRNLRTHGQGMFYAGPFRVDLSSQTVFLKEGEMERELDLTPIEFKLLVNFLRNEGEIFSRRDLIAKIWGKITHVSEHTVDAHISTLRKKIGGAGQNLKAVLKRGYRFIPHAELPPTPPSMNPQ
jgi:two-component system phosphate regulon response regulator PhoB